MQIAEGQTKQLNKWCTELENVRRVISWKLRDANDARREGKDEIARQLYVDIERRVNDCEKRFR
jgi:hypothetical protein